MTKGSYAVGENAPSPQRKDSSYKSFICALLIFLCICLIILLASVKWGGRRSKPELNHGGDNSAHTGEIEDHRRNEEPFNKTHEKIRMYEEITTEREIIVKDIEPTHLLEEDDKTTPGNRVFFPKKEIEDTTEVNNWVGDLDSTLLQKFTTTVKKSEEENKVTTEIYQEKIDNGRYAETDNKAEEQTSTEESKSTVREFEEEKFATELYQERLKNVRYATTNEIDEEQTTTEASKLHYDEFLTTDKKEEAVMTEQLFAKINPIDSSTTRIVPTTETNVASLTSLEQNTESLARTTTINLEQENEDDVVKMIYSSTEQEEATTESAEVTTVQGFLLTTSKAKVNISTTSSTTSTTEVVIMESESDHTTEPPKAQEVLTTTSRSTTRSSSTSTSTTEISLMESEPEEITEPITVNTESPTSSALTKSLDPVCKSGLCKTVSSRMLSMMNHTRDPCEDFYNFACGNAFPSQEKSWEYQELNLLKQQLLTVDESSPKFVQNFRDFYQSCLRHEDNFDYNNRMKKLEELVQEVGQFQFNETTSTDFTDLVASLLLRQSMPLFDIGLDVDKQTSNLILQLNLPHQSFLRTGLDDWSGFSSLKKHCLLELQQLLNDEHIVLTELYESFKTCQRDHFSYLNSLEGVIRELEAFSDLTPEDLLKEIKEIRFTIEFEVLNYLANLPPPATILEAAMNKKYQIRRVADLKTHFSVIDWKRLLETLTDHEIQDNTLIQVYFSDHFKDVFSGLKRVSQKKLNNAFLAIYAYDLFFNTVIPKEKSTRDSFCMDLSKKLLPGVWTHFVQNTIPKSEQDFDNQKVGELFDQLKNNFCQSLDKAEWIDSSTKPAINKKCESLNLVAFAPIDNNALAKNYYSLNVTDDYSTNLLHVLQNFRRIVFSTEGTPISANTIFSYFLDPLGVKPLTFYANPMIVVPLGLMRKTPMGLPDYMNKVRVGFPIARQLARHFDPVGITYKVTLQSNSNYSYYEFIHFMSNLMDFSTPRPFDGKNITFAAEDSLSLIERIVDNAAFVLIYDSLNFKQHQDILPWISVDYSREKVSFVALAQEMCKKTSLLDFMLQVFENRHLPAVLRLENIVGHSEQFTQHFQCRVGCAPNYPEKMQFPFLPTVEEDYQEADNA